jgi:hypothetical protein
MGWAQATTVLPLFLPSFYPLSIYHSALVVLPVLYNTYNLIFRSPSVLVLPRWTPSYLQRYTNAPTTR